MKRMKVAELKEDLGLYPRYSVDPQHVREIAEAIRAGATMPPVVIEKGSNIIADGIHRCRGAVRVTGEEATVTVEERTYKNKRELFLDAIRMNADHGRALTQFDRAGVIITAARLEIDPEMVATAMNMTMERFDKLRVERIAPGTRAAPTGRVPLKRTIARVMRGKQLSKKQYEANKKLSGMSQSFYARQLIIILENGFLETENERLLESLKKLRELIDGALRVSV